MFAYVLCIYKVYIKLKIARFDYFVTKINNIDILITKTLKLSHIIVFIVKYKYGEISHHI